MELETLEEIRKDKDIPVILLSAKSEDIDKINGLNIGADDYITKPFNPDRINCKSKCNYKKMFKKQCFIRQKQD